MSGQSTAVGPSPVTAKDGQSLQLFISYAHKDSDAMKELHKHLASLEKLGWIHRWQDTEIRAGDEWEPEIAQRLDEADVILLLITPDFIDSKFAYPVEMERAIERHKTEQVCVIPVLMKWVALWDKLPFAVAQVTPSGGKFIADWVPPDKGFYEAVKTIADKVEELIKKRDTDKAPLALLKTNPSPSLVVPRTPVVVFVARYDEEGRDVLARLKKELAPEKRQVVALHGPFGVGKSALAARAEQELKGAFAQRVLWISAAALARLDFSILLDEIATQLGFEAARARPLEEKQKLVCELVGAAPILIVVDDFHLITPAEQKLCIDFLTGHARCSALLTTWKAIDSERVVNVSLETMDPEGTKLYLARLIEQTKNPRVFADIEPERILAVTGSNLLLLQWVIKLLDESPDAHAALGALSEGEGDAAQRVFAYAFALPELNDGGREVLLALALFVPGASRRSLAVVAGIEDEQRLDQIVDRLDHLWPVRLMEGGRRVVLENLPRELLRARLSVDERAAEFRRRFVSYFGEYAETRREVTPANLNELESERDNLLAAMDVAYGTRDWAGVMLVGEVILEFLYLRGYWDEVIRRAQQAGEAAREAGDALARARFATSEARVLQNRGEYGKAQAMYEEALAEFERLGSDEDIAKVLLSLGRLHRRHGERGKAMGLYRKALEIQQRIGDERGMALTWHSIGRLKQDRNKWKEAREAHRNSLEIKKRLGDRRGVAVSLGQLAGLAKLEKKTDEALQLYQQSLRIDEEIGNLMGVAISLQNLGDIKRIQSDLAGAREFYEESLKIKRALNEVEGIAISVQSLGELAKKEGKKEEAARLLKEALDIYEKLGSPEGKRAYLRGELHGLM